MKEKVDTQKFVTKFCDGIRAGKFIITENDQGDDDWAYIVEYIDVGSGQKIKVDLDMFSEAYVLNDITDACSEYLADAAQETAAIMLAKHISFGG